MAKDPAMLWYWSDWHSGTTTLSRFLKGCYMDLLHAQFNSGHLSLEEIKTVLGSDFGSSWPTLQKKFLADSHGNFFNVRLEEEKNKRAAFTESRRKNLNTPHKGIHIKPHMASHMDNVNENDSVIVFGIKKECRISVKKVYAGDKVKIIYDLELFFANEMESLETAGWIDFDGFMSSNPGKVFDDDNHVYNAFKQYSTTTKPRNVKKLSAQEIAGL